MKIREIAAAINEIAPLELAQAWDNVGLVIGDPDRDIGRILLTIDVTKQVLAEAGRLKTQLIVSYHPVIWDGLKKIVAAGETAVVYELIRCNISVFSIHTALDAVRGGVNDQLASIVGIVEGKAIGDYVEPAGADRYKLVVFVPVESAAKVANAVFAAGAGAIGNYSNCGFQTQGEGSFLPLKGAKPAIGSRGKLQKVREMRFETIVPAEKLRQVIAAMRNAHPYETPAFDCFRLHESADKPGLGRMGELERPAKLTQIIGRLKKATGAKAVGIVGRQERIVRKAAVCAGSCGRIISSVIAAGCDVYVTGELKHHQALAAQEANLSCVCLSHTVSERFMLRELAGQLKRRVKGIKVRISKKDADPFKWKSL